MKQTDQWIETVFDGTDNAVDKLKSGLSDAQRKEIEALRALKSDLKSLREVPECQLTVNHLRQAMLNQKPVAPQRSWFRFTAWVPVAAAAGLALFMANRPQPLADEFVRSDSPKISIEAPSNSLADSASDRVELSQVTPPSSSVEAATEPVRNEARGVRRIVRGSTRRASEPITVAAMTKAIEDVSLEAVGDMKLEKAEFDTRAMSMKVKEETEQTSINTPVVVVGDTPNPETGAADAQEISRPSDMVFGG